MENKSLLGKSEVNKGISDSSSGVKYWEEVCFSNNSHNLEMLFPIIEPYLGPDFKRGSAFEFGCLPCRGLIKFCRKYGFIPRGVDFCNQTKIVDELAKKEFPESKFFTMDVTQTDISLMGLHEIVISNGFIEHFSNVEEAVAQHIKILKDGGLLIINVPNLSPLRALFWRIFDPKLFSQHNPQATNLSFVKKIIERNGCTVLKSGLIGNPDLWLEDRDSLRGILGSITSKVLKKLFYILRRFKIGNSITLPIVYWIAKKGN